MKIKASRQDKAAAVYGLIPQFSSREERAQQLTVEEIFIFNCIEAGKRKKRTEPIAKSGKTRTVAFFQELHEGERRSTNA